MEAYLDPDTYGPYFDLALGYALQFLGALLVFLIGKRVAKALGNVTNKAMSKYGVDETLTKFISSSVYFVLLVVVIMAALGQLGIETTSFMAILGAAGLAVGLALKDTLANVGAAVIILIFRPFKVGDFVEAGGATGTVESISLFTTTISPVDNRTIIVPNAAITAGNIVNFSNKPVRRVDHVVGIGYGDDLKKAKEVLYGVIRDDPHTLDEPAPLVAVSELGDNSVNFTVRAWVKSEEYWDAYFGMIEEVKLALDANGISIPYPQMDVHFDTPKEEPNV
ncbi:mechanosensitive ion channel [Sulfurimonas sp. HSL-3221]|uniref:mechanosensitive ion channel family protein n=1 Tax=Sulfurimonadaceae TaxID=2771471 RepID=UPI001E3CB743|nr:mechanosensitive ion channel domain-containing protein [Sulfurimonas sp. HSL-3221]UFS62450.1 mechanosensitive ion channel [Sulfurimonas sp. HSL-3221]